MNKAKNLVVKIKEETVRVGAKALIKAETAVGRIMTKRVGKLLVTVPLVMAMLTMTVAAETGESTEVTINTIIELLKTWISRLGGILILSGGIQIAISSKDDNAAGKTRGLQCMILGNIIAVIGIVASL